MFDSTVFNSNNATIVTDAAAIAAAYAANMATFTAAAPGLSYQQLLLLGRFATQYREEVARTLMGAGLRDLFEAARDARLDTLSDASVLERGASGLQAVWAARIAAGQLGPHT